MGFKVKRVGHVVLRVKDVARSRRFFEEVMGVPVVAQNERGMVFFSTDVEENHHMIAIMPGKEGAAMPTPDQIGMQHVSFELGSFAELQEAYQRLKSKNVPLDHTTFHGVTKSVYFYDPDGNRFEFYCNVPAEQYLKSVPNPYSRYGAIEVRSGKTGFIRSAGYCVATWVREGSRDLITVVLGAPSNPARFNETRRLLQIAVDCVIDVCQLLVSGLRIRSAKLEIV